MGLPIIIVLFIIAVAILILALILESHDNKIEQKRIFNLTYKNQSCETLKSELDFENQLYYKSGLKIEIIKKYLAQKECKI